MESSQPRQKPRQKTLKPPPPPPPGFKLEATGDVVDGDTLRTVDGENARLWGVDAFEAKQQGRNRSGALVPIGERSTGAFDALVEPDSILLDTGAKTFGRPVVGVETNGQDAGQSMLDQGYGMAAPEYLKADPQRLTDYMEAERLSRVNRRGGHSLQVDTPAEFRDSRAAPDGSKTAIFFDEPSPIAGLRPEIEQAYIDLTNDPKSTAADIVGFANQNGFRISEGEAESFVKKRNSGASIPEGVRYAQALPQPLTDPGDGATGAAIRGGGDTILLGGLDEFGGIVDSVGLTQGRESIWNSDRRFGDVLWNNIDQNRAILNYDAENHPYAQLGGQVAGAFALPFAAAARTPIQLAKVGAVEGGAYAFGSGEGGVSDRAARVPVGAGLGAAGGYVGGKLLDAAAPHARRLMDEGKQRLSSRMNNQTANDIPPPPPGYQVEAMESGLSDPALRSRDVIDVNNPRPITQEATEAQLTASAQNMRPQDVLPVPSNEIGDASEAAAIQAGRFEEVKPVDERSLLEGRAFQSQRNPENYLSHKGPMDLVSWVRARGGINDSGDSISKGGDLKAMGLTNGPRQMDFAQNDVRMGPLLNDEGSSLDDMALAAWEEGFFPDNADRPSVDEFLEAMGDTYSGSNRRFMQDDFEEVDRFYAQQEQNWKIAQAEEEGAPLSVDKGEPIGPDDLQVAPDTAYEDWPAQGVGKVGNIDVSKLDSPQDIQRALKASHDAVGGFDPATRGKVTHEATQRLAGDLGMTSDQLLARRKGQAFNAEEALAARQILAKSGNELVNVARRISRTDSPGDEALADFRKAWVRHVAIQEQVSGATAEAGRALQAFRIAADSKDAPANVLRGLIGSAGGPTRIQDAAEMILDLAENPGQMNSFSEKAMKPGFKDMAVELWYNFLLSGPQTHVVNMTSNTLTALSQIPEHAAAATIGAGRRAFNPDVVDRVMFSELGARSVGLLQGTKEGLKQMVRTFRTGEPSDAVTKVEDLAQKAIPGLQGKGFKERATSAVKNPLRLAGSLQRTPTRALAAEDELFKAMARRMELSGLAVREARKEGLKGQAAKDRAAELVANPTDEMLQRSFDYGRYLTFTRPLRETDGYLSAIGSMASRGTEKIPPLKAILPFVRTPTNLIKYSFERSPFAPAMKDWRRDFRAGGAKKDLAIARSLVGSGFAAMFAYHASEGRITGSPPSDKARERLLRADGWQPYSFKVGDKYYSYLRLDPFASTIGTAADIANADNGMTDKQREDGATLTVASIISNLGSKTWLSGITDALAALDDPERNLKWFSKRLIGSATVPTGVAQAARTIDPTFREANTIGDYIKSRVPGMGSSLPAKRDFWGQPIVGEGGLGPDAISPIWESTRKNDPVTNELLNVGVRSGPPQRGSMTPHQYGEFQERAGTLAKESLGRLIETKRYQAMPTEAKAKLIKKIISDNRETAKKGMFGGARNTNGTKDTAPAANIPPPPPGFKLAN
ncbi:hypothetical protein A8B75_11625 [Sphingomonadales bacterium EhC05]|nr:hypothetical protein A8B75_11625 [Sphingomonadales bacterium EhC05]